VANMGAVSLRGVLKLANGGKNACDSF
jgi:hypothetical protein